MGSTSNIHLRQVGVRLVEDNQAPRDGAKKADNLPGIYTASAQDVMVENISAFFARQVIGINRYPNVIQATYVKSFFKDSAYGFTPPQDRPPNGFAPQIKMDYRFDATGTVESAMRVFPAAKASTDWGFVILNLNGADPVANAQAYGSTIAHEVCHVLGLNHRQQMGKDSDGLPQGQGTNVMSPVSGGLGKDEGILKAFIAAEDLDLLQAIAITKSRVFPQPMNQKR